MAETRRAAGKIPRRSGTTGRPGSSATPLRAPLHFRRTVTSLCPLVHPIADVPHPVEESVGLATAPCLKTPAGTLEAGECLLGLLLDRRCEWARGCASSTPQNSRSAIALKHYGNQAIRKELCTAHIESVDVCIIIENFSVFKTVEDSFGQVVDVSTPSIRWVDNQQCGDSPFQLGVADFFNNFRYTFVELLHLMCEGASTMMPS